MSKVLVDRELLEKWADKLKGADSAGYGWEDLLAAEVRGAIAQPAEAEGVEVVAYADPKAFENFKTLGSKGGVHGHEWMWAKPDGGLVGMVREDAHLAALSAVTAERDRLRELINSANGFQDALERERDQLRAEVEGLRAFVTDCTGTAGGMVNGNRLSHRAKELIAAMAAKEA